MIASWRSTLPSWSDEFLQKLLAAFNAGTAVGATFLMPVWNVHLYTAGPGPISQFSVLGDFTEATFPGYVAAPLNAVSAPTTCSDNNGDELFGDVSFQSTISAPTETIQGYYVTDSANTELILSEQLGPVPLTRVGDAINLKLIAPLKSRVAT